MFHTEKSASIQEIGPRFTLKLEYLRRGLPDDNFAGILRSFFPFFRTLFTRMNQFIFTPLLLLLYLCFERTNLPF